MKASAMLYKSWKISPASRGMVKTIIRQAGFPVVRGSGLKDGSLRDGSFILIRVKIRPGA
jgi:hypothetical protein